MRAAELVPGSFRALLAAPCPDCSLRTLLFGSWSESRDLGPLGVLTAPLGATLVDVRDGLPRWHWSVTNGQPDELLARFARPASPDGSVVLSLSLSYFGRELTEPICLSEEVCLSHEGSPHGALIRFGPDGDVRWMRLMDTWATQAVSLSEGSTVFVRRGVITRLTPDGEVTWQQNGVGLWVGALAIDEPSETLWARVSVPDATLRLGDATVRGCRGEPGPRTGLLASFDARTGELCDVVLRAPAFPRAGPRGVFNGRPERPLVIVAA